jgi:DeoR family transcriptional regulator, suf operon transcriptional repressor
MHATRQTILDTLNTHPKATVNDLAEAVGVKAITVRHHLNALLADGLVILEEQRQSVGRPLHVFALSQAGRALYPHRYTQWISTLLEQLTESLAPSAVDHLISALAKNVAEDARAEFADLPPRQRMRRLIELLTQQGFSAQWHRTEDGLPLVELHCPYYALGQRHAEICQIDEALIRTAMETEITKGSCLFSGDNICTYILQRA